MIHLAYSPRLNNVLQTPQLPACPSLLASHSHPQPRSEPRRLRSIRTATACIAARIPQTHEKRASRRGGDHTSAAGRDVQGRRVCGVAICNMSATCGAKLRLMLRDDLWLRNSMSTSPLELFYSKYMIQWLKSPVPHLPSLTFRGMVVFAAPVIRGTTSGRSTWRHSRSSLPLASHADRTTVSAPTVIRVRLLHLRVISFTKSEEQEKAQYGVSELSYFSHWYLPAPEHRNAFPQAESEGIKPLRRVYMKSHRRNES